MSSWIGIDPGKHGAAVLVTPDVVVGHPAEGAYIAGSTYLPAEMAGLLRDLADDCRAAGHRIEGVAIEKQHSRPGQGHLGPYTTGYGYGLWIGILATLGWSYRELTPAQWRRALGLPRGGKATKGQAIALVQARLPDLDLAPGRRRVPHTGLADAAAIALAAGGGR